MKDRRTRRTQSDDAARVAEEVRVFYERHPYPPPVGDLDRYRKLWDDRQRRRADSHLFRPAESYREDRSVLVAGCGTGQAAKYALRWPRARVTGIDVSATSISETEELKGKYRLDNLEVHRLPVERAGELGCSFEQVVCTGVLHHLPEPDVGLRALREVLEPGGAMHLMVYAPYGRAGVYLLQEYCRRLGIGSSSQEIRDLAVSLRALPKDHPLAPLLNNSPDFREESALADALLNPQDRPYSVPQLLDFLRRGGLRFGRWVRQAPYLPQCGALASSPHGPLLTGLPAEEQYAAVELFRGTMLRHSAVVYRDDGTADPQPIHFPDGDSDVSVNAGADAVGGAEGDGHAGAGADGEGGADAWHNYVPHRLPGTLCIQERLPPGAAAVLINPSHTYTDIFLPIDTGEKRLFDAIDGERTIGEMANEHGHLGAARAFFQRLWWYDQVVFDASRRKGLRSERKEIRA